MRLSPFIINLLGKQCGRDIKIPADCVFLSLDIEGRTGERIGATTLKRLAGLSADEREPHETTLNVIARYLGYKDWQDLSRLDNQGNSGFDAIGDEVRSADLTVGCQVEIAYLPDRLVRMVYQGNNRYQVTMSENSKLAVDDELEVHSFVLHHPLLVVNVHRDGVSLGQFTAGRISGLLSIKVLAANG